MTAWPFRTLSFCTDVSLWHFLFHVGTALRERANASLRDAVHPKRHVIMCVQDSDRRNLHELFLDLLWAFCQLRTDLRRVMTWHNDNTLPTTSQFACYLVSAYAGEKMSDQEKCLVGVISTAVLGRRFSHFSCQNNWWLWQKRKHFFNCNGKLRRYVWQRRKWRTRHWGQTTINQQENLFQTLDSGHNRANEFKKGASVFSPFPTLLQQDSHLSLLLRTKIKQIYCLVLFNWDVWAVGIWPVFRMTSLTNIRMISSHFVVSDLSPQLLARQNFNKNNNPQMSPFEVFTFINLIFFSKQISKWKTNFNFFLLYKIKNKVRKINQNKVNKFATCDIIAAQICICQ